MKLSRRAFLVGASATLATPALHGTSLASPSGSETATLPSTEYATLLELEKCIGCGACVAACHDRNGQRYPEPHSPMPDLLPPGTKAEDWSTQRDVEDRLTPYNWLFIQSVTVPASDSSDETTLYIPRRCLHCQNPPCANLCPWGAASRNPATGTVNIDDNTCLGGAKCRTVCPWHIPQRQSGVGLYLDILPRLAGNGIMLKCDRCNDSFAHGELPACVEVCPEQVQSIGPRDEILAKAQALAKERGHYLYGVTDNGGTNTFYLSPVPFETLAQHSQSGPGKPTLAPVPNSMATAENLTGMLVFAPFAGLAGGLVRTARRNATPVAGGAVESGPADHYAGASETQTHTNAGSSATALPEAGLLKKLWIVIALVLGFTGVMQMPIATRYGLTKLPGLAWTGDFYITLNLHYIFAGLLLALGGYWGMLLLRRGVRRTFSGWDKMRLVLLAGLVGTGVLRVAKNLSAVSFDPGFIMFFDLLHLGLAVGLGIFGVAHLLRRKRVG